MPEALKCSRCGAILPGEGWEGLCPKCIVRVSMDSPADSPSPSLPSQTKVRYFGDYELLEEIASGGMGIVYKARQRSLNRIVAVKMILSGPHASAEFVRRFRAEAEAAANLSHPNIVAIYEIGEHEGQHYFSMEYIDGKNLAEWSAGWRTQNREWCRRAAEIVQTVAEAIYYAHQRGILHRDLKPSNVLIDQAGQPHITDFGLAKRLTSAEPGTRKPELTVTGQVLGSPNYMPPEQAQGKHRQATTASDIYSVGAILYHGLTGLPPFAGETITETLQKVVSTEPLSPRQLNPAVPRDLETVCLKCLEKEPHRRYTTALELAEDLAHFLRDEPILARKASPTGRLWRWCRRKPLAAGLSALATLLLLGVVIGAPSLLQFLDRRIETRTDFLRARAQLQARQAFLRAHDIPARDPQCPPETIDLSDYYTAGLTEDREHYEQDQGGNHLSELPRGLQRFANVQFDVRGLIQLASTNTQRGHVMFPQQVRGIKVNRSCRRLHVLHASVAVFGDNQEIQIGSYIIHFANQKDWQIPLIYGRDLRDWWTQKDEPLGAKEASIAWQGTNPAIMAWQQSHPANRTGISGLRLFKRTWESPFPGAKIESIDFVSAMAGPAPFLIAITLEP